MERLDMIQLITPFRVAAVGTWTGFGFMISFIWKYVYFMTAVTLWLFCIFCTFVAGKGAGSLIGGYMMKAFGTRPTYRIFAVACTITGIVYFLFNQFYLRKRPQVRTQFCSLLHSFVSLFRLMVNCIGTITPFWITTMHFSFISLYFLKKGTTLTRSWCRLNVCVPISAFELSDQFSQNWVWTCHWCPP